MEIMRICEEDKELFDWLDPLDLFDRLALPHYFALTAIVRHGDYKATDEDDLGLPVGLDGRPLQEPDAGKEGEIFEDSDRAAGGIVVASRRKEGVVIEWICVAPEYRGKGVAVALVNYLRNEVCRPNGLDLMAQMSKPSLASIAGSIESAKTFFYELGFVPYKAGYTEYSAILKQFFEGEFFSQKIPEGVEGVALSEMKEADREGLIDRFYGKEGASSLYFCKPTEGGYDPEISFAIKRGDAWEGLLLIKRTTSRLFPVFMYAKSTQAAVGLILTAASRLKKEEGRGKMVLVIDDDDSGKAMGKKLFSHPSSASRLLRLDEELLAEVE